MNIAHHVKQYARDTWDEWTKSHQFFLTSLFLVCLAIGILIDLILVLVLHVQSISLTTWIAEYQHPTLIAFGVIVTIFVAWLVRSNWRMVLMAGLLGGHLFIHY